MTEETEFPRSIEEFGYKFNEEGELRHIETNDRFLFFVKPDDRSYNQEHYDALGDAIGEFIENELVDKYNLVRQIIPVESDEGDDVAKSRIYMSDDALECKTLLLIIQGGGVVRPGQWARQVIINDSLKYGSMFPYISKAQELKWGTIVLNPNENYGMITKGEKIYYRKITGSESPQEHCIYVWDNFVKNAKAEKILIMAHSYGGICTAYMLDNFADDFKKRVKGIAFTDSVHSYRMIPESYRKWFHNKTINFIKSDLPLDDPVNEAKQYYGCICVSAGHPKHEYTSGAAIESVFEFLQVMNNKENKKTKQENKTDEQLSADSNEDKTAINTQTQETSGLSPLEKGTTVIEEPQLNSTKVDEPPNAQTQVPQINSAKEIIDELSKAAPPEIITEVTSAEPEQEPLTNNNESQEEKAVVNNNTIVETI